VKINVCSEKSVDIGDFSFLSLDIQEGDWNTYRKHCLSTRYQNPTVLQNDGGTLDYRRKCALAYLGRRAQLHGGVCSRTQPRILTSAFLTKIEETNRAERFRRYPWLETLLKLLAEIERVQDEITTETNVISLMPALKSE
jgi:hypothetical protein